MQSVEAYTVESNFKIPIPDRKEQVDDRLGFEIIVYHPKTGSSGNIELIDKL